MLRIPPPSFPQRRFGIVTPSDQRLQFYSFQDARMTTIAPPFPTTRQDIAGVAVADLAARYGTPTYVYDTALICRPKRMLIAL